MFKKFKDKLAEEMKQSPARLQASMQQLAQAVVSPALSDSSIQDLSASNDNFSLAEGGDETPKNSPANHGFQNVDLTSVAANSMGVSRRSSVSSVTSVDAASFFPTYDAPINMYHLQSDMEQSASEADENITPQLDRISKDQLYASYKKVQMKYHKYRGRYTDLANHYREIERVKGKLESLLVETQDKALRRIGDLKEQCQLEQQAKAHLEAALRNDIEEKDHIIDTLNTKVRLLQSGALVTERPVSTSLDEISQNHTSELLVDLSTEIATSSSQSSENDASHFIAENAQLRGKLEKLENLIAKYKESLKRNKDKIAEISQEKSIIERDFDVSCHTSTERLAQLEDDLNVARNEITNLRDEITAMRKREEESAISLAENKLSIHRELEVKEEQIKELRKELKIAKQTRDEVQENSELGKPDLGISKNSNDMEKISKVKVETIDLTQEKMQKRINEIEERMVAKIHKEEEKTRDLTDKLATRDEDLRSIEKETIALRQEVENYREWCESLRDELSRIKDKEYSNEIGNRNIDAKRVEKPEVKQEVEKTEAESDEKTNENVATLQKSQEKGTRDEQQAEYSVKEENYYVIECEKLREELSRLKKQWEERDATEKEVMSEAEVQKDETIRQLNLKIESYVTAIKKIHERSEAQQRELNELRNEFSSENELSKLREDCENKSVEILGMESELKSCKSTINDLREKMRSGVGKIETLTAEKICLISNILEYRKIAEELKKSCESVKSEINDCGRTTNEDLDGIKKQLTESLNKLSTMETERQNERLIKLENVRDALSRELDEKNSEILAMREKVDRWNETSRKNNQLIAEIDRLNFKIFDLEKLRTELETTRIEVESLKTANLELTRSGEESAKLSAETENREKTMKNGLIRLRDLETANEELKEQNERLKNDNSQMEATLENERTRLEERYSCLEVELSKRTSEFENEKKLLDDRASIQENNFSKLKVEHENRETLVADYLKKLTYFESECAKREAGLEKLRVEMEERERLLENKIQESKNFETELSKLSEERSNLLTKLSEAEKSLDGAVQKTKNHESELSKLNDEKSKVLTRLEEMERLLENAIQKSNDHEAKLLETIEEKTNLAKRLKESENFLHAAREELGNSDLKLVEREALLNEANGRLEKLQIEFSNLSEEETRKATELEILKKSSTEFQAENETLKKKINTNNALVTKLKALKSQQSQTIQENQTKIGSLEEKLSSLEADNKEFETEKLKTAQLTDELSSLQKIQESLRENISKLEKENRNISEEKENLFQRIKNLEQQIVDISALREESETRESENKRLNDLIDSLKDSKEESIKSEEAGRAKLEELEKICVSRVEEIVALKDEIARLQKELLAIGEKSGTELTNFEALRQDLEEDFRNRSQRIEDEYEEKYQKRELEMKNLEIELKSKLEEKEAELRETLENSNEDDRLRQLANELRARLQDNETKLLSSEAKRSQIEELNEELRNRTDELKENLETSEAEQSMRLKQLVKEFQAQLHDKDEELQAALDKRFESQQNYESDLVQQYREQLKDFQIELTAKSEQIESLMVERKEESAAKHNEMEKLIETISKIKQEHIVELLEIEKKWKAVLKQKSEQLDAKHDEEVNELTQEWQNERRNDEKTEKSHEELESTSRVAIAAVQSNTGSFHSLQQTMVSQRRELAELRKLVKIRQDTLEDSTEIEYLKNILYEYMMGRETMVLARVIAAIVKFDQEQTTKILKKEEDKLTLLGSLGLA